MIKRLSVILVVSLFLAFIFAGGAYATTNKAKMGIRSTSSDAPASENGAPPAPVKYMSGGLKYAGQCTDIAPAAGVKIEHTQIGSTWYDYQKNGSMGRMIAVTSDGYRESGWMYTAAVYPGTGRYIRANTENPGGGWIGATNVDGGAPINSGYSNTSRIDGPPGAADLGATVLIFHRTGGTPTWYTTLVVDDEAGGNFFTRKFDVPDYITGAGADAYRMEWPKVETKYDATAGKDYFHIVGTEGNTAGGVPVMVAYTRCYIKDGPALLDTLICQAYNAGAPVTYKVVAGANGGSAFSPISHFDSSCSITPVPVTSKISKRVAVAWLRPANCNMSANRCDFLADICFIESMNSGEDWVTGAVWPPPEYNVTNFGCGGTERGFSDLNATYDFKDSLHIIYVTAGFDSTNPGYYQPGMTRLYHWSKAGGTPPGKPSMISSQIMGGVTPGSHNINIGKMSVSALDPSYHPGGDSVYLYATWTQFDSADVSANGFSNGELMGCGSNTGGHTWGNVFNLTNTPTPSCAPGSCLSEHWSSLAQNMYGGDLHIQYICDKDAGGAIQDVPSVWMDNPVMYLRLASWPIDAVPRFSYQIVDPATWYAPPLKVTPNGNRTLVFNVNSIGNANLIYSVSSDNSCIQVSVPPTSLAPTMSAVVTAVISGAGACNGTLISGNILVTTNDTANALVPLTIQAVVANDYYECPRDPATFDTLNNGIMEAYFTANSLQWMHDISTNPDTVVLDPAGYNIFFQGGPFVATTVASDTLVGRYYGDNDARLIARAPLNQNSYADFWLEYSYFVEMQKFGPPLNNKWWWWEMSHENVFFKSTASDDLKHTVIKFVTIERKDAPGWWPTHPTFTGYEDTYFGYFMDMDAPYDSNAGQSARNSAGYDATNNIAWQRGWGRTTPTPEHPEYNDYYTGMALIQGFQAGESVVPAGTYNLANDTYLYPQSPWGWLESEFYQLAKGNVVGAIQFPDSLKDRSQIITAKKLAAGTTPVRASFTIVETFSAEAKGVVGMQEHVAAARAWVASKPFILCGDANNSTAVEVGDIVYLISYLYKSGSAPAGPMLRGDANGSGSIEVGDIVYLISYLYKSGPAPKCLGVW